MPSTMPSVKNAAANSLSPHGANIQWEMQTDKSTKTQQGEKCLKGKHVGLEGFRGTQLSLERSGKPPGGDTLAETPGNIRK